jgi:hypothetical protein
MTKNPSHVSSTEESSSMFEIISDFKSIVKSNSGSSMISDNTFRITSGARGVDDI